MGEACGTPGPVHKYRVALVIVAKETEITWKN
jgi:hypothetical protein